MEPFEFANNGLSLTLSVFSVIIGMAYPILLQAIQRIDEIYRSSRISLMLTEEPCYHNFQKCLVLSIACSFSSLFILQICNGHDTCTVIWLTSHLLVTLLLLRYTLTLFTTILDYYHANKLMDRVKNLMLESTAKAYLLEIFDIAKYASFIEDEKTYREAADVIYNSLIQYVEQQANRADAKSSGLTLTSEQVDVMKQILNMLCKSKNEENFFMHDSRFVSVWYSMTQYVPLSDNTRSFIWSYVMKIIESDNEYLIMSYWASADQYFRFVFEYNFRLADSNENINEQRERFKQFHIALGTALFHKEKYDWLKKILYFTQTLPPTYSLIDNTFVEILDDLLKVNELVNTPGAFSGIYTMPGVLDDANSDAYVANRLYRYFALLTVRLNDMDYNVSYCNPMAEPDIHSDCSESELKRQINSIQNILDILHNSEFSAIVNNQMGYDKNQIKRSFDLVESYQKKLESSLNEIKTNPQTDPLKIEVIREKLISECQQLPNSLPQKEDSKLEGDKIEYEEHICVQSVQVPIEDLSKRTARISANLEEVMMYSLSLQTQRFYNFFFLQNKPVVSFTVRYQDLMDAWKRLGINEKFTILSMGVYLGNYTMIYGEQELFKEIKGSYAFNGAKIKSIPSLMRAFIIIPNSYLPYVEYTAMEREAETFGVECIDKSLKLYSNVNSLDVKSNQLRVYRKARIAHLGDSTRYILLNIKYNTDSSDFDINRIENISKWMVNEKHK